MESTTAQMTRDELVEHYSNGERDFTRMCLANLDLSGLTLRGCDFSNSNLTGASFRNCDLTGASFVKADISNASFSRAKLAGASLGWSTCIETDFIGVDFRQMSAQAANFSRSLFIRARFEDSDCLGAIFARINGMAAQFQAANLECSDFSDANLSNANLEGVNGNWANFSRARLNWVNFTWAQLDAASFEEANLTGACLRATNLSFCNMQDANMLSADAYFANFSGALVSGSVALPANISSSRISFHTWQRSGWTKEELRDWQNRGATVMDFESFPKDVQEFICEGFCNLRITFGIPVGTTEQSALEALIFLLFGSNQEFQILSVLHDGKTSRVAFRAVRDSDIERFTTAVRKCTWHDQQEIMLLGYREKCMHQVDNRHTEQYVRRDIIGTLDSLCANMLQINALLPVSENDHVRMLTRQMAPEKEPENEKTSITWASVGGHGT